MEEKLIKVSVIIPAYNEEATIIDILKIVKSQQVDGFEFEIIVIDDGSSDNTAEKIKANPDLYTKFIKMEKNSGKGSAVKKGLSHSTGDYILFQDADLEYNPNDYRILLEPVKVCGADIVMGSRLNSPKMTRVHYFWHKIGNRLITLWFNILNNTTFTDVYSCYLLYKRKLLSSKKLKTLGWEQHAEILTKAVKKARTLYEVPISYYGRTYDEGKKIRWYHILKVFFTMFRFRILD